VILVKRGAHVTIVARDKGRLSAVEDELKVRRLSNLLLLAV
jgi:short-subunit dehydrogenase